jgi:hypothetical protein
MVEVKKEIIMGEGKKVEFTFRSLKAKDIVMAKRASRMPNRQGGFTVDEDKLTFVTLSKMIVEPKITYEEILELDSFVLKQFSDVMEELESSFLGVSTVDNNMEGDVFGGQLGSDDSEDSSSFQ